MITENTNFINMVIVMMLAGLLPFAALMVTSYVKIVVVFYILRNALGLQQVPPNIVLNTLAILLSMFVMAPVFYEISDIIENNNISKIESPEQLMNVIKKTIIPIKSFLKKMIDKKILAMFKKTALGMWPQERKDMISTEGLPLLLPAFTLSELTNAFKIGFLIYLPFVVIDLIVSNILLALGMMMLSPMTISAPFKLLLFIMLDGWVKVINGLLLTY